MARCKFEWGPVGPHDTGGRCSKEIGEDGEKFCEAHREECTDCGEELPTMHGSDTPICFDCWRERRDDGSLGDILVQQ